MASTSNIDGASSATGLFTKAAGGSDLDKESFLLLLVTQFQHQDPLNPMEDKEFIAQLAQFSALEQQMNMSNTMQEMVKVQEAGQVISAASYIGREVSARGFGVSVKTDAKTDKRTISTLDYYNDEEIGSGTFNIMDAAGFPVATVKMQPEAVGRHTFPWDGLMTNGSNAPDGVYTVSPVAFNIKGERIALDTNVTGEVRSVEQYEDANGRTQLFTLTDDRMVTLDNVRKVSNPRVVEDKPSGDGSGGVSGGESGGSSGGSGGVSGGESGDGSGGSGGESGDGSGGSSGGESGGVSGGESGGASGGASGGESGGASGGESGGASGGESGGASGGESGGASEGPAVRAKLDVDVREDVMSDFRKAMRAAGLI